MNWILKPWSELTTDELYELLGLRAEVFVVEQSRPSRIWMGWIAATGAAPARLRGRHLAAYARIMAPASATTMAPP